MGFMRFIFFALSVAAFTASGQSTIGTKDSVDIKLQIEGFYSWYIGMIQDGRLDKDFNPTFVRKEDGMTTLDFSNYAQGLRKFNFAEDLIRKAIGDYKSCVDSLASVPYEKFLGYELDEHARLGCDFANRYEWTGGQVPKDKAELSAIAGDGETAIGQIDFISNSVLDGQAIVFFRRSGNEWSIYGLLLK